MYSTEEGKSCCTKKDEKSCGKKKKRMSRNLLCRKRCCSTETEETSCWTIGNREKELHNGRRRNYAETGTEGADAQERGKLFHGMGRQELLPRGEGKEL